MRMLRSDAHTSPILQAAWNKHGEDAFSFTVLEACTPDNLLQREQYHIDTAFPRYNVATVAGSPMSGRHQSDEFRQMISAVNREHWADPDFRQRVLAARPPQRHSAETRQKISDSHKARGKALSDEHKQKLLACHLGKTASAVTRQRMSDAHKGRQFSPETLEKLRQVKLAYWAKRKAQQREETAG